MVNIIKRQCQFCGQTDPECFEYDKVGFGFWCEECDGFTYFNSTAEKHKYTLILEDKSDEEGSSLKTKRFLNKRISPLRYPGSKAKLAEFIYSKIQLNNVKYFVEPFAGGASTGLSLLKAGIVEHLVINDLDKGIYALFNTIINDPEWLITKINTHNPTHKDFFAAQEIIKTDYLNCNTLDAAWSLLLVNRLAYSGIYKANPLGGKNGSKTKLLARWNPQDLCRRIKLINQMRDRITVYNMDAFEVIEEFYWKPNTTLFIDPPYYKKGKNLYHCYFNEAQHIRLNLLLDHLYRGCPGADIILTYDNEEFIDHMYLYPEVEKICRKYTI